MTAFLNALAFLTRLIPARSYDETDFARCVPFFAPTGLVLGMLCTAAAILTRTFMSTLSGFENARPLAFALAALLWLALEIWLTRGLHWDGLADLADAASSPAPRFWEILKDSRLGVFGALSLLLAFCGQWISIAWHVASCNWLLLILAPAWGRACVVWLAAAAHPHNPQSLGGLTKAGASCRIAALHALAALGAIIVLCAYSPLAWAQGLMLLAVQCWLIRVLAKLASEKGGFSGDFLGAAIVLGQSWFLLATLL
ncbi:MAG: adenosylcobinamide-GDP ribazoletransferase [Desulfovibrio sp.]|jgi:adenosylcobinamide-GDP ribazoletransferase|nr:adenosylcobinamide-GDP ribazoletransferase [Desulfovibrio sp.]